ESRVSSPASPRALHVVQVSRDASLLDPGRGAESRARQRAYAAELEAERPGSRMTVLVLSREQNSAGWREQCLTVTSVADRAGGLLRLLPALLRLQRKRPIDVLTTQSPFEELWLALLFARWWSVRVVAQIHFDPFAPAFTFGRLATLRKLRLRLGLASLRWTHSLRVVSTGVERGFAA